MAIQEVSTTKDLNKYDKHDWKMANINPSVSKQIIFKKKTPDSPTQEVQKPTQKKLSITILR